NAAGLDSVRVTVTGPTTKAVSSATQTAGFFDVTIDQLAPGSYNVDLEGYSGGGTSFFGSVGSVTVTAGQTTPATISNFVSFVPTLVDITGSVTTQLSWPAVFSKVTSATGYIVEMDRAAGFPSPTKRNVPDTTTIVAATDTGVTYVRIRAVNARVPGGGAPSAAKTFRVIREATD